MIRMRKILQNANFSRDTGHPIDKLELLNKFFSMLFFRCNLYNLSNYEQLMILPESGVKKVEIATGALQTLYHKRTEARLRWSEILILIEWRHESLFQSILMTKLHEGQGNFYLKIVEVKQICKGYLLVRKYCSQNPQYNV